MKIFLDFDVVEYDGWFSSDHVMTGVMVKVLERSELPWAVDFQIDLGFRLKQYSGSGSWWLEVARDDGLKRTAFDAFGCPELALGDYDFGYYLYWESGQSFLNPRYGNPGYSGNQYLSRAGWWKKRFHVDRTEVLAHLKPR